MTDQPAPGRVTKLAALGLDYGYAVTQILAAGLVRQPSWAGRPGQPGRLPVVLVPGIYESWRFLAPLGRRLAGRGHRVDGIDLGLNGAPLAAGAAQLARMLAARDDLPVILLAHSKGGLLGLRVLQGQPELVAGLVCINTPFGGSSLARWLPTRGLRALTPAALAGSPTGGEDRVTSIGARWDPHVPEGSQLVGATNLTSPDLGHFRPVSRPATQLAVIRAIAQIEQASDS